MLLGTAGDITQLVTNAKIYINNLKQLTKKVYFSLLNPLVKILGQISDNTIVNV